MYVTEGGNVSIVKADGQQYSAQKIPIKDIGRKKFVKDFSDAMKRMNKIFFKRTGKWIWEDASVLDGASLYNGSTSYMMDLDVPDEAVLDLKPTMGDIDLIVPEDLKEDLWVFLKELEDSPEAQITDNVRYIGNNKNNFSMVGDQINAVFDYQPDDLKEEKYIIQVDFEFLEFVEKDGKKEPSEFSKFGHSSTLRDLEAGVKAVFHKYLLRAVSYGVSKRPDIIQVTKTATADNWEKKIKKKQGDTMVKFSVSKGVRLAYEPLLAFDGSPIADKNGNLVFREIPTSNSTYSQSIEEIFEMFFNRKPSKDDIKNMWSFVGVVDLIKKYLSKQQIDLIIDRFFQLLWEVNDKKGSNVAQELERDDKELDYDIKMAAVDYLMKEIPQETKKIFKKWEKTIETYYKQYGQRDSLVLQALSKARLAK